MVPAAGVEPARYRYHRILSPARLPIPSFRHMQNGVCRAANTLLKQYTLFNVKMQHFFFAKDGFLRRYPAVFYRQLSKTMKFFNGVMKRKSDGWFSEAGKSLLFWTSRGCFFALLDSRCGFLGMLIFFGEILFWIYRRQPTWMKRFILSKIPSSVVISSVAFWFCSVSLCETRIRLSYFEVWHSFL